MEIPAAWSRLAVAGRELGSGPAWAAENLGSPLVVNHLMTLGVIRERALPIGIGSVLGRIMAEEAEVLAGLEAIHNEWRRHS
jgi:hypothetical protein